MSEEAVALAAAVEINELRDRIVTLTTNMVGLNAMCWELAVALDLVGYGVTAIEMAPLELVRRIVAERDEWRTTAHRLRDELLKS